MRLSEVVYSIQGEGVKQGTPSVFIRLWGCNLTCGYHHKTRKRLPNTWQCDSTTSWLTDKDKTYKMSWDGSIPGLLIGLPIPDTAKTSNIDVVFTGGEPLLFIDDKTADTLYNIDSGFGDVFFETNGTIDIKVLGDALSYVKFNCSPKLSNSGVPLEKRYKPDILYNIGCTQGSCFKFVVSNESDLEEIEKIVEDCELPPETVYLMPEGQTRTEINKHLLICAELAKQTGWNVSNRMQVQIWDKCMGV